MKLSMEQFNKAWLWHVLQLRLDRNGAAHEI